MIDNEARELIFIALGIVGAALAIVFLAGLVVIALKVIAAAVGVSF